MALEHFLPRRLSVVALGLELSANDAISLGCARLILDLPPSAGRNPPVRRRGRRKVRDIMGPIVVCLGHANPESS